MDDPDRIPFWQEECRDTEEARAKLEAARSALAQSRQAFDFCDRVIARGKMVDYATQRRADHAGYCISRAAWVDYWQGRVAAFEQQAAG